MTKIPLRVFLTFPPEPDNRMKLMLNALRHEPIQVILAFYLDDVASPQQMRAHLQRDHKVDIPNVFEYLEKVLEPAHQVKKTVFPEERWVKYEPSHWGKVYGSTAAQFTLRYCIDNGIILGDLFGRHIVQDQPTTYRRYRMLRQLYENHPKGINVASLSRDLMAKEDTIKDDLTILQGLELITMELLDVNKIIADKFRWKQGHPQNLNPSEPEYLHEVARLLFKHRRGRSVSLHYLVTSTGYKSDKVVEALSRLKSYNMVKPDKEVPIKHEWDIHIADRGRKFWETYFAQLYNFFAGKQTLPLFESREAASDYVKDAIRIHQTKT